MAHLEADVWKDTVKLPSISFTCGYCGAKTGNNRGYHYGYDDKYAIYICPNCGCPCFKDGELMKPESSYGEPMNGLPDTVQSIYDEARNSFKVGAYTGVILICRKILANVAVYYGAKDGDKFVNYVDYLVDKGYVPPKSKDWIDKIRLEGNKATHNHTAKNKDDAKRILDFVQMLLLINFKFNSDYNNPENSN